MELANKPLDDNKTYVVYGDDTLICNTCKGEMKFDETGVLVCTHCKRVGIYA